MLIKSACLDWLTLSESYTISGNRTLSDLVQQVGKRGRPGRRLGYEGYTYNFQNASNPDEKGTLFHGERVWKGAGWGLLVASGESAHWLIKHIWRTDPITWTGVHATRIDVQVTIPWPGFPFMLRHLELTSDVRASVVHGVSEGDEWAETLYLGSRDSPIMVRAYRKRISEDEQDWLRVEVEYKRDRAKELFLWLLSDKRVGNWFQPVEKRCLELYNMIDGYLEDDPETPEIHFVVGKTFHWLSTTVANCICRLLDDDDQHEEMVRLVSQWHEYSQACQSRRIVVQ